VAKQLIEWLLRLGLGGVFIYAGVVKVLDTQQFTIDVQNYQLTSWTVSILVAVYLPWLEIFAGLGVILRRLYEGSLAALFGMTVVFLIAICSAWMRGLDITCGCFGKSTDPVSYPTMITRDLVLMAAVMGLGYLRYRQRAMAPMSHERPLTPTANVGG
jgi:putative oxidoreductase